MNNYNKNHHQINRIATPLKIDSAGRVIEPIKHEEVKKDIPKEKKKIEVSPFAVMISIMLLILLALILIIIFIVVPEYKNSSDKSVLYNDEVTTSLRGEYLIKEYKLNDEEYLTESKLYNLNSEFNLYVSYNGINNTIIVNNEEVLTTEQINSTVAITSNILLIITKDYNEYSLRAINKDGKEIYTLSSLEDTDLSITEIKFNLDEITITATKMSNNEILIRNQYTDICDSDTLKAKNVSLTSYTDVIYEVKYNGEEEFTTPVVKSGTTISDYQRLNC